MTSHTHGHRKYVLVKVNVVLLYWHCSLIACTRHLVNNVVQYAQDIVGMNCTVSMLTLTSPFLDSVLMHGLN